MARRTSFSDAQAASDGKREGPILGIDIGGTKCAVTIGIEGSPPEILLRRSFATAEAPDPERALPRLARLCEEVLAEAGSAGAGGAGGADRAELTGIGISCGGPLDSRRGVILSPPNLPGWDEVPVVRFFHERFGAPVRLQNDANACALAEWRWGAARGSASAVFLTFGTGLGAGIVLDGRLYDGANSMAGEVGHLRLAEFGPVGYGKAGSWEGFCSGGGIAQLARSLALERLQAGERVGFCHGVEDLERIDAKAAAEAALAGDPVAASVFELSGSYLGKGLSLLIDVLNPETIVIGGIFARCEALLRPAMERVLERESLSRSRAVCSIVPAALGENVGDYAALALALEEA
ncbi:MAG TPA: ROK family protein [Rectinemataceae bacterium]|nr:ROK family protein [Rectinemataceae bacterium]